ncbi:MAG: DUF4372 domain-containing protein [Bacteroidales bacterium]|nr:DUF4372 domain-containing protein [Bacteroidales bacterium]
MNAGKTVLSQLMMFRSDFQFQRCVDRYKGDFRVRRFTCNEHFLVMSFAQLTARESLRDIENSLTAFSSKLYHSGLRYATANPRSQRLTRNAIGVSMLIMPRF